ncbi:hypothetical protein [Winogradskyella immobilis]|uniref:Membrane or secreted protein n=1 Tax=Winogradskyella immobilis TaxID=2816852 RepID=A0ABS8EIJ0_9FLAO|nr:hypothetical protein [Winogradskyella immobilis]MCC1483016.1 hypothetical protein [Winogradskyella immobilis]MCG0015111.1 hypothetical protein [Winogradskyella immobilis]
MKENKSKRNLILGVLFFLPVAFLLMLYPAKHNYIPLDIINDNVVELNAFKSVDNKKITLQDHITVIGFLGKQPLSNSIAASNLKELVYDKFKGFKKFQIVIVMPSGTEAEVQTLEKEISSYEDLRFWHYVYGSDSAIKQLYNSLKIETALKEDLSTNDVFIIDKDLNQRGRIDARDEKEVEANKPITTLSAYDCIEVAIIKNKMSEDMRVLFTEYRQKRKGNFDSTTRRANDLKESDE